MTLLAPGAISITDGAVVIAAETVAPRLGLKPEALQAEVLRGQVCSLVEAGVDEDEGRTRVTVRYDARSWTSVIEPDGKERATARSASAIPMKTRPTSSHRDQIAEQLRTCLQNMAAAGLTITYGGLARLLELSPPNTIHQITVALERLMGEDAEAGRPFVAALVISKTRGGLPAMGFFDCARRLGRFTGDPNGVEARSFHAAELKAAQKFWGWRAANCVGTSSDRAASPGDARGP
jgi:NFU1 iron-sulfur cluster scaffold homolog, mitochondrial